MLDFWAVCRQTLNCSEVEVQRMTPALMWAMLAKKWDELAKWELPLAQISCLLYNSNRDTGDAKEGRAPAPVLSLEDFRLLNLHRGKGKGKKTTRQSKANPGGDHLLHGAQADRGAWEAYARGKLKPKVQPLKTGTKARR